MNWIKQGLIFKPKGNFYWNRSYASVPTPIFKRSGDLRVYYSSRDINNRSYVSFIDLDINNPKKILYEHQLPVLSPGKPGMFDDCGVMPSHAIVVDDEIWMYYLGWNVRNTIPYHNSIGLAISSDGGITFKKFSEGPLFDRNYNEPYYSGMPYVIKEKNLWKMWYLSNTKWIQFKNKKEPYYHIKYAESSNGIDWIRNAKVAIDFKNEKECGIVRACVNKIESTYIMWYSYRNIDSYRENKDNSYRIGYAESTNGNDWERKDSEAGIDRSNSGWDSQMIEYPFVLTIKDKKYMFYNGNKFGESGFGYAELIVK
tara:strand:- start:968 stop:1906 length:939 start_codon:yes stop_codon:yes gene_type:complete